MCVKAMKKWTPFLILLLFLILLAACNSEPAVTQPEDTLVSAEATVTTPAATGPVTPVNTASVVQSATAVIAVPTVTATPVVTATPEATASVATATSTPTPAETPAPTETPTSTGISAQPPLLTKMAAKQGTSLEALDCQQLVLVATSGSDCKLYTYECNQNGLWSMVTGTRGYVGAKGVTENKREGDQKTPAGIYALGFAFGHDANPTGNYPYRKITSDSYWVDDPDSEYYNQWVTGTAGKEWDSAENLWSIKTEYALAVLVEYNYGNATVPGKGSAIFLHVGDKPTAGCIAIPKSDLKELLGWLDEDKMPHIIISEE